MVYDDNINSNYTNGSRLSRLLLLKPKKACSGTRDGIDNSIYFLHSWAAGTTRRSSTIKATAWHATFWHATSSSCLVNLHHNWVHHTLKFFLLGLEFILLSQLVFVEPVERFLNSFFYL